MKKFEEPVVEVMSFVVEDVITTSINEENPIPPALMPPCG